MFIIFFGEYMFKTTKAILLLIGLTFCIFNIACTQQSQSKVLNEVLTKDNLSTIVEKVQNDKTVSKEQIDFLANGIARFIDSPDSLYNKTLAKIIEEQKEFFRNSSLNALSQSVSRLELKNSLELEFSEKLKIDSDTLQADGVRFTMTNLTSKDINFIKGEIRIVNKNNQLIKVRPINYVNITFKAGEKVTQQELWTHEKDNQYDLVLRDTKELIAYWVPETISFADGTKISIEPKNK